MNVCCVLGCVNSSQNSEEQFHQFPTDLDLCLFWIQACGKPEYFDDFAFSGVLPFLGRKICSAHYNCIDFNSFSQKSVRFTDYAAPPNNFSLPDIKKENLEDSYWNNNSVRNKEENRNEISTYENDLFESSVSSSPITTLQNTWRQTWQNVENVVNNKMVRSSSRGNKDDKISIKGYTCKLSSKYANETIEQRKSRLYKNAVRTALKRSLESEEEVKQRRMKNALRAAYRRSVETPDQRVERRKKDLQRSAKRRREETELQAKIRKYKDAMRAALRRRNETPEQKQRRRMVDILRAARRRSTETAEQRQKRLKADRERAAKRRLLKKLKSIGKLDDFNKYKTPDILYMNSAPTETYPVKCKMILSEMERQKHNEMQVLSMNNIVSNNCFTQKQEYTWC